MHLKLWYGVTFNAIYFSFLIGHNLQSVWDEKTFYTYENQRWNPISGFTSHGLPTDRQNWTDETGRITLEKDDIKLPSNQWNWVRAKV